MGHRYHVNTSSNSSIPTAPSHVVNWVTSLGAPPFKPEDDRPSTLPGNSDDSPSKTNTFRNVAKVVTRFMKKSNSTQHFDNARVENENSVENTLLHVKSLNVCSAKTVKSHRKWKSLAEKQTARVDLKLAKKAKSMHSDRSSTFETLKRLAFKTKHEQNSYNETKIQRCEEIICVPSPAECRIDWNGNSEENCNYLYPNNKLDFGEYETSQTLNTKLHFLGKSNSVESSGGEASSADTEESGNTSMRQVLSIRAAASVYSWAKKVQKKAKFRTLAPYSPPIIEDMDDDNVYEVLKYLKTLPKPGRFESRKPSSASKYNEEALDTASDLSTEEKVVTLPSRAAVPATNCSNNSEAVIARNDGNANEQSDCQQKREKFAQKRSIAMT